MGILSTDRVELDAIDLVVTELQRARAKHPIPMRSTHDGHSIIREEFEEMWEAVRANDLEKARKECVQLAAMALRFLIDVKAIRS